jgi:hypothetical protein
MQRFLEQLDRRWIFLMMFLAIAVPVLMQLEFRNQPGQLAKSFFDAIERLPDGSKVLVSFDYDPASEGELQPMATAMLYHIGSKRHKLYVMALWPLGDTMASNSIQRTLLGYFPQYRYGEDYVELGFKAGNEGVIKLAVTDLVQVYPTDARGTPLGAVPMMRGIENLQAMDLVISISAGYPGSKEWAQYFIGAFPREEFVTGTTGVQSVSLYPYIPNQIEGMLGAIKGAADYEALVTERYPGPDGKPPEQLLEGHRRMGPQLTAHLLIVALIIAGNVVYFLQRAQRRREAAR